MTAFELIQVVLVFIMIAVTIWFCSRSPLWLAKFIDKEVIGNTDVSSYYRPTREFIAYIREHPESWQLRYPRVLHAIRLTGWWAFTILAVGLLMVFLASIGVAKVYG